MALFILREKNRLILQPANENSTGLFLALFIEQANLSQNMQIIKSHIKFKTVDL